MQSSRGKLLQCGHRYDRVTPPCPPAGVMIRRKKSLLFSTFPCIVFKLLASFLSLFQMRSVFFRRPIPSRLLTLRKLFCTPSNLRLFFFLSIESTSHHFGSAVCVRTAFYLFQKLLDIPSLSLLQERNTPTFLV